MGLFNWLSSDSKSQDNILDKKDGLLQQVGSWVGNMNYTDEERAEMVKSMNEGISKFVSDSLNESTTRSTTRRAVAVMWIKAQLLLIFLTALMGIVEYFSIMYVTGSVVTADKMVLSHFLWSISISEIMFWSTLSIIAFFFSGYIINNRFNIPSLKK